MPKNNKATLSEKIVIVILYPHFLLIDLFTINSITSEIIDKMKNPTLLPTIEAMKSIYSFN
jgi:hypothetical protein